MSLEENCKTPGARPYANLLGRLDKALSSICSKTEVFQTQSPLEKDIKEENSEFGASLAELVREAESINSNLNF